MLECVSAPEAVVDVCATPPVLITAPRPQQRHHHGLGEHASVLGSHPERLRELTDVVVVEEQRCGNVARVAGSGDAPGVQARHEDRNGVEEPRARLGDFVEEVCDAALDHRLALVRRLADVTHPRGAFAFPL